MTHYVSGSLRKLSLTSAYLNIVKNRIFSAFFALLCTAFNHFLIIEVIENLIHSPYTSGCFYFTEFSNGRLPIGV